MSKKSDKIADKVIEIILGPELRELAILASKDPNVTEKDAFWILGCGIAMLYESGRIMLVEKKPTIIEGE